jgi:hypothetical protein
VGALAAERERVGEDEPVGVEQERGVREAGEILGRADGGHGAMQGERNGGILAQSCRIYVRAFP